MHEARIGEIPEVVIRWSWVSRREFLHVDDLADACIFLMNSYNEKEFINIGTGEDVSIKELAYLIKDIVWYEGELVFDTSKPDGMPKKLLDVSKMSELWWKYKTDFIEWLKNTYEYFKKNI